MTPQEKKEFEDMKKLLKLYQSAIVVSKKKIYFRRSVLIRGLLHADRVYTKRSGSNVELTT